MTGKDAIRDIMWEKRFTQKRLGEAVGAASQTGISNILNRGTHDMRTDILAKLANAMGCEVVIRDPATGKEWIITCEE